MYGSKKTPREMMSLMAQNVRALRKKRGLSQVKLAEKSGIALSTLKKFESTGILSLESFFKLCKALNRLEEFESVLQPDDLSDKRSLFDV